MRLALNVVLVQTIWFACVLGGAADAGWVGPVAVVVCGLIGFVAGQRFSPALALLAAVLGVLGDGALAAASLLRYPPAAAPPTFPLLPPFWMIALWVGFSFALRESMDWICADARRAALFGALGGPLAYWAGERLGAITLGEPRWLALLAIAVEWMAAMSVLAAFSRRRPRSARAAISPPESSAP